MKVEVKSYSQGRVMLEMGQMKLRVTVRVGFGQIWDSLDISVENLVMMQVLEGATNLSGVPGNDRHDCGLVR